MTREQRQMLMLYHRTLDNIRKNNKRPPGELKAKNATVLFRRLNIVRNDLKARGWFDDVKKKKIQGVINVTGE